MPGQEDWKAFIGLRLDEDGDGWGLLGFDRKFESKLPVQVELPFLVELRGYCTAFLVAEHLLVTAAHCLPTGAPSGGIQIVFLDSRHKRIADSYAECALEPAGTWRDQACDTNQVHDRAVCYLKDVSKLTMLSRLDLAAPASDITRVPFWYASGEPGAWQRHPGSYPDHQALVNACFESKTNACTGWSGTPSFTLSSSGEFAGLGLLSRGDECRQGDPPNTNAAFSSVIDAKFEDLLRALETKPDVPKGLSVARVPLP